MSAFRFAYIGGLMVIEATIYGMETEITVNLALDTASNRTILKPEILQALAYSISKTTQVSITTGTRTEKAFEIEIRKMEALGLIKSNLYVIGKELPIGLFMIDGLLGLDFFQKLDKKLCIDFQNRTLQWH